jgi:hypothetical protein
MPSSTLLNFKVLFNFALLKISPFLSGEITKLVGFRQEKTHFSKIYPIFWFGGINDKVCPKNKYHLSYIWVGYSTMAFGLLAWIGFPSSLT